MSFFLHKIDSYDDGNVYHFMCLQDDKNIYYARVSIEPKYDVMNDLEASDIEYEMDSMLLSTDVYAAQVCLTLADWTILRHHNDSLSRKSSHYDVYSAFEKVGSIYGHVEHYINKTYDSPEGKYIKFREQKLYLLEG